MASTFDRHDGPHSAPLPDQNERVVYVVDDDPHVRNAIATMTKSIGYASEAFEDGKQFLSQFDPNDRRDACLLLDYLLPEMDGLSIIHAMNDRSIPIPVVLITGRLDSNVAIAAMRGGAVNCVQKPFTLLQFQAVVEDAFGLTDSIRKIHEAREHHRRFDRLTDQEKRIVRLAADGYPNKQIASRLGISIKTVEKYRRRAYATLNVDSTARMARAVTLHSMHNMFA